jgi:hypothetical protein
MAEKIIYADESYATAENLHQQVEALCGWSKLLLHRNTKKNGLGETKLPQDISSEGEHLLLSDLLDILPVGYMRF